MNTFKVGDRVVLNCNFLKDIREGDKGTVTSVVEDEGNLILAVSMDGQDNSLFGDSSFFTLENK